ncbi:hypothetical protein PJ267_21030 [Arthrobacter sp. OVS8]|nr:hypothetical protein PJ267_21030 [Arthrobacter sp. OVS8]
MPQHPRDEISRNIPPELASATRFLELRDGIPSPAGPFNYGLEQATAEFVCILGSDDSLEPGALRQWLELARTHSSAMVIAPQRHAGGAPVRTPPVRVRRQFKLDPVKDRLSYRTAPLGLLRRSEIQRLGLEFSADLRTGRTRYSRPSSGSAAAGSTMPAGPAGTLWVTTRGTGSRDSGGTSANCLPLPWSLWPIRGSLRFPWPIVGRWSPNCSGSMSSAWFSRVANKAAGRTLIARNSHR